MASIQTPSIRQPPPFEVNSSNSSSTSRMEGYIWKCAHSLPKMQRRYCVLEGTMLTYYSTEKDARVGATPRGVLEITSVKKWDGKTRLKTYNFGFEIEALASSRRLCHVESDAELNSWISAITDALNEPLTIVAEEKRNGEMQAQADEAQERLAVERAAHVVTAAKKESAVAADANHELDEIAAKYQGILAKFKTALAEFEVAKATDKSLKAQIQDAKVKAHDAKIAVDTIDEASKNNSNGDNSFAPVVQRQKWQEAMEKASALAVETESQQAIHFDKLSQLELVVSALQSEIIEMEQQESNARRRLEEAKLGASNLRTEASAVVEAAKAAKALTISHCNDRKNLPSAISVLAEGYLLFSFKSTSKPLRRYFCLYGKTLSYYTDQSHYEADFDNPLGVLHVNRATEWDGKIGGKLSSPRVLPNAFSILTVEGKTLYVSAPVEHDVQRWIEAIEVGVNMPPLSPSRARAAAKSFATITPVAESSEQCLEDTSSSTNCMEGYLSLQITSYHHKHHHHLLSKSSMKSKYCVLSLQNASLQLYESYTSYQSQESSHKSSISIRGIVDSIEGSHEFQLVTAAHGHIRCSATSEGDKKRWVDGISASLARQHASHQVDFTKADDAVLEFRNLLKTYLEDNDPSKVCDTEILLELFMHREAELLSHLDQSHGTSVSNTPNIELMIDAYRVGVAKLSSQEPPTVEGYLVKQGHLFPIMKELYCALVGNTLRMYENQSSCNTQSLIGEITISDFSECDGTSPLKRRLKHGFKLMTSEDHAYVCAAASDIEKQKWILGLRRHLGWARAQAADGTEDNKVLVDLHDQVRDLVRAFYEKYNASKMDEVESLVAYFRGNEATMFKHLDQTFGTTECQDNLQVKNLLESLSTIDAETRLEHHREVKSSTTIHAEGYLLKKHSEASTSPFSKWYCVLEDTTFSTYQSFTKAQQGESVPSVLLNIVQVAEWGKGKLGFQILSSGAGTMFCEAASVQEKQYWMSQIRLSITKVQDEERRGMASDDSELVSLLSSYFLKHSPSKLPEVEALCNAYQGRELSLLQRIDEIYQTRLVDDPLYRNFISSSSNAKEVLHHNSVHYEGYVIKRGHNVKSMKKRYFVLDNDVLTTYSTHEDSKIGKSIKILKIVSVSHWDGKGKTRRYDNGFAFNSESQSTTYCSGLSSNDKKMWMDAMQRGIDAATNNSVQDIISTGSNSRESSATSSSSNLSIETTTEPAPVPPRSAYEGYLQCRDGSLPTMSEKYYVHGPGTLRVYRTKADLESHRAPQHEYEVLAINEWDGQGVLHTCKNPFKLYVVGARGNVTLHFNAATKEECQVWREKFAEGIEDFRAEKLFQQLAVEEGASSVPSSLSSPQNNSSTACKSFERKKSLLVMPKSPTTMLTLADVTTSGLECDMEGYVNIKESFNYKEVYMVLRGVHVSAYQTLEDARNDDKHKSFDVLSVTFNQSKGESFSLHTSRGSTVKCSVATESLRTKWVHRITCVLNTLRGEELLHDEKQHYYHIRGSTHRAKYESHSRIVHRPGSSIEGVLAYKTSSSSSFNKSYFALSGNELRRFANMESAIKSNEKTNSGDEVLDKLHVVAIEALTSSSYGFIITALKSDSEDVVWTFETDTVAEQQVWMRALQEAVEISVAEKFLNTDTASLVSSDVMETHTATIDSISSPAPLYEGYIRIKSGRLAVLKERYAVLRPEAWVYIYRTKADAIDDSTHGFISKFEAAGVRDWLGDDLIRRTVRYGFKIETLEAGTFDVSVSTSTQRSDWCSHLFNAITTLDSDTILTRDSSLPKLAGASMEGYIQKKGLKFKKLKVRYVALIGTQLVFYTNQNEAVANHVPLSVFEVLGVKPWEGSASDVFNNALLKTNAVVASSGANTGTLQDHGFMVKTSTNRVLKLCAANAAERMCWMETLTREIEKADEEERAIGFSMKESDEKSRALKVARTKVAAVRAENDKTQDTITKLMQKATEDDWGDDDDDDATVDMDHLEQPAVTAKTAHLQSRMIVPSVPPTIAVNSFIPAFLQGLCGCFFRPAYPVALVKPLLKPETAVEDLYQCDFYDAGSSDDIYRNSFVK